MKQIIMLLPFWMIFFLNITNFFFMTNIYLLMYVLPLVLCFGKKFIKKKIMFSYKMYEQN